MSLNMPELLTCISKTKYGWISLEYAWICLKYNVKDTVKLFKKLDNIYKWKAQSELLQTSKIELFEDV